eukprot:6751640-Alexandrium_andersonii.AAC.1
MDRSKTQSLNPRPWRLALGILFFFRQSLAGFTCVPPFGLRGRSAGLCCRSVPRHTPLKGGWGVENPKP